MSNISYIAKKGLSIANAVGAWLADTTAETVVSTELVINGDFATDTVWIKGTGWTIAAGVASHAAGAASSIYQNISVTNGKDYIVTFTISNYVAGSISIGMNSGDTGTSRSSNGTFTETLTAGPGLAWGLNASSTFDGDIDNVSYRLFDKDLSSNAHDLAYYGTITKTPVATGSNVMAYSGFSEFDYLEQSYEPALDFGTGDFSISFWITNYSPLASTTVLHRSLSGSQGGILIRLRPNGQVDFYASASTTFTPVLLSDIGTLQDNKNQFIVITRVSGLLYLYIDNELLDSASNTTNLTYANAIMRIGRRSDGNSEELQNGKLSFLRILNVGLSTLQIKQIYDDQKVLFNPYSYLSIIGNSYNIDFSEDELTRSEMPLSNVIKSLGGNQETLLHRVDVTYSINFVSIDTDGISDLIGRADLSRIRNFLQSVAGGESFTFDAYGTEAVPDSPVTVIADGGHKESRVGTTDNFTISMKVTET